MGTTYDLAIIGGGPAGYTAAIRAAQLGMHVVCIEKESRLGGTCLRVGCIPSKALLDSSELFFQAKHEFADHGITAHDVQLDIEKLLARKDNVVGSLTTGIAGLFKKHKIEYVQGSACLIAPGQIEVKQAKTTITISSKNIILATGSTPTALASAPFDGKHIVSSTEALQFSQVPKKLLVVGGGYIGLELGSVWARLGSEVTVVEFAPRIAPAMDDDLTRKLQRSLEAQGLRIQTQTKVVDAKVKKNHVEVVLAAVQDGAQTAVQVDKVLVCIGRTPYAEGLGLEKLGIARDPRGYVVVDQTTYATNVPGIYAIGDLIPGPMLAHKAEEEGIACVERLAGQAGHVNYDAIPYAVYTWPELAGVGKTQTQCKAEGRQVRVGTFPFLANGRARAANQTEGFAKVITDAKTDRLLGVHILGPRASDLVAEAVLAMEFGGSAEDIARSCHAHPTFSEAVKEAALDALGRVINR